MGVELNTERVSEIIKERFPFVESQFSIKERKHHELFA